MRNLHKISALDDDIEIKFSAAHTWMGLPIGYSTSSKTFWYKTGTWYELPWRESSWKEIIAHWRRKGSPEIPKMWKNFIP